MTKEELKKEAEEYAEENCKRWEFDGLSVDDIAIENYISSAEPREKQIEIDAEQIRALQKQNGELTDKVRELEAQIEELKCCGNCRFNYCERNSECIDKDGNRTFHCWNEEKEKYCDVGKNGKYQCWEIKEK